MKRAVFYCLAGAACAGVLTVLLYGSWMRNAPAHEVAIGTPLQHDDFLFTPVSSSRQLQTDGSSIYRIRVDVSNDAKVVNYDWRDSIAYVEAKGSNGETLRFSPLTSGSLTISPGVKGTARLEFRLPPGATDPRLRFWDGIFMGDALNGAAYSKAAVRL